MLRPWKLQLDIKSQSKKAIYLQIADAIISDIRSGRLKEGTVLPGTRKLAEDLKLNRNTIVEAYNVLLSEEWLVTQDRKGTFVNSKLPILQKGNINSVSKDIGGLPKHTLNISFEGGYPDRDIAPINELARAYRQIFNSQSRWQIMGYESELGSNEFRNEIASMLNFQRGMQVNDKNICITRGSQMALYLVSQCMLKKGDIVAIENPGYPLAWKTFKNAGAKLLSIEVDKQGMNVESLKRNLENGIKVKAVFVTSHHQFPTTVSLSLERRLSLIQLSNQYSFTIIEDDYDHEFHFDYRPLLPLSSYKELKNFVYIGTMSKIISPALRIGYLVSNHLKLISKVGELRKIIDIQGDSIMEQAVLQLIQEGTIRRYLKKAISYYKNKRDFTEYLLNKYLKDKITFDTPNGGLAYWIIPLKNINWKELDIHLQQRGIKIITPDHYGYNTIVNGIRLSYGTISKSQLEEGIKTFSKLI
ncbi:PLP-dependent aminotransferase family protein [Apibacter muscae]|uniref:PLP-dependent aminotransferase family protein n=1 Tax=Apibacter muscae TaxID=2509004 RepID=A0A563DBY3_9FLAO|nr:PLP-dependent aminotransferase family protein [Apibacter muscae]TWP27443.1 PLP-dependent aminotransferase family protein [Apibacter muscae]